MSDWWWALVIAAALVAGAVYKLWRPLRRWGHEVQAERAQELFRLQRERLELLFMPAAAASGKPRGLRWVDCSFEDEVLFARDRETREFVALVGVTIRFDAVKGSGGLVAIALPKKGGWNLQRIQSGAERARYLGASSW